MAKKFSKRPIQLPYIEREPIINQDVSRILKRIEEQTKKEQKEQKKPKKINVRRPPRRCPLCENMQSYANFAKHNLTCRGPSRAKKLQDEKQKLLRENKQIKAENQRLKEENSILKKSLRIKILKFLI